MLSTQNRQTTEMDNKPSVSSENVSCSAKGDGDVDDDVGIKL